MDWDKVSTIERTQFLFISITSALFVIVGAFGNIISFIIFNNKLLKNQLSTNYIKGSIVMNMITIFYLPIILFSPIWILNSATCKIYNGVLVLIIQIQAWVTALSSIDRMVSVLKPHSCLFKNKLIFQLFAMILSALILFILLLPQFIYYDIGIKNSIIVCMYKEEWARDYLRVEFALFRAIIPFILMIISSITITIKMSRAKANLTLSVDRKREKNLFKSLIASDIFFILFRLPYLIYILTNQDESGIFSFLYAILTAIGTSNNVFIFIIFILFNKLYKQLFIKYMRRCKKLNEEMIKPPRIQEVIQVSVL
jgi:hypothetical protein